MKNILWVILNILLILSILPYNTFALDYDLDMGEIKKNKITVNSVGNGVATANMLEADLDETITLTATPYSSSLFLGWYEGDNLLSNSTTYNVNITKDTTFTAKFTDNNILADKNTSNNWVSTGYTQFAPSNETRYGGKGVVFSGVRYQAQYFKMNLAPNREYSIQFSIKSDIVLNCVYILNNTAIFSDKSSGGIIKNSSCCVEKTLLNATNKDISSWTDLSITFKTNHSQNATDTYYLYLKFGGTSNSEILENKAYVSDLSLIEKGNSFIAFNGNAIRSTGNQGLRYTYKLADNLLTDGYYGYKVKEIGAIAIREDYLMYDEILVKDGKYNYNNQIKTPRCGVFYNSESGFNMISDDGIASALLYNIGYNKATKQTDFCYYSYAYALRVYMDIEYNGEIKTLYSTMQSASVMDVMHEICDLYENAEVTPDANSQLAKDYTSITTLLNSTTTDKNGLTIKQIYDGARSLGNIMVFGDSYSSFAGSIPNGHAAYYTPSTHIDSGICNPNQMWWQQIANATNSNLLYNTSWSGTTICKNGPEDTSRGPAFIDRLDALIADGYFEENQVDTVFVFGGTNDSWNNRPIGELKFEDWSEEDLRSFAPAVCYMISRLKSVIPDGKIVFLLNNDLSAAIDSTMKAACEHYNVDFVELEDIDKLSDHPTKVGMIQIKEQTLGKIF